jgi:hypothetical protein
MNKHTPAPWSVDINTSDPREAETIRGGDGIRIASTYKIHEHRDDKTKAYYEARANSRLIASAPDLLETLRELIVQIYEDVPDDIVSDHFRDALVAAEAAIYKATGDAQ